MDAGTLPASRRFSEQKWVVEFVGEIIMETRLKRPSHPSCTRAFHHRSVSLCVNVAAAFQEVEFNRSCLCLFWVPPPFHEEVTRNTSCLP